jgi:quinolinate synthase
MENLITKILDLKQKRNAIILAHNYQLPEVQDIADYVGDSLGLSITASKTNAEVIVFCGVHFMAETASILCPQKKVLMPDINAGCPMANMINAKQLQELKNKHPHAVVVCYVNTTAEVKALCDIICTSSNAVKIVESIPKEKEIIFIPDQFLGYYVSKQTNRRLILWNGFCRTHLKILPEYIKRLRLLHPKAEVLAHPECTPAVVELAEKALGTGKMVSYVKESRNDEFIIATEYGIIHRLQKENPEKKFYLATEHANCPNMKLINLEKILWSLEELKEEVKVTDLLRQKALSPISRMLEVSSQ